MYHIHVKLHHIKKENIGLIETMGLAVLPSRLKGELAVLSDATLNNADIRADERVAKHDEWVDELKERYSFTPENIDAILRKKVGAVFEQVPEDTEVHKHTDDGRASFMKFIDSVNGGRI